MSGVLASIGQARIHNNGSSQLVEGALEAALASTDCLDSAIAQHRLQKAFTSEWRPPKLRYVLPEMHNRLGSIKQRCSQRSRCHVLSKATALGLPGTVQVFHRSSSCWTTAQNARYLAAKDNFACRSPWEPVGIACIVLEY